MSSMLIEIDDYPELKGSKVVVFSLFPRQEDEIPVVCRLHYHRPFFFNRSLDNAALVAEARRELMLLLESI